MAAFANLMQAYKYTHLLWHLIGAMDSGKYDTLSFEEIYRRAQTGTIPAFLADRFGSDIVSMMEPEDWTEMSELWANLANAVDAERKFGVTKKGMCLLMAYTLESLQQKLRTEKEPSALPR